MGFADYMEQRGMQQGVQLGVQQEQRKSFFALLKKLHDPKKVAEWLGLAPDTVKVFLEEDQSKS